MAKTVEKMLAAIQIEELDHVPDFQEFLDEGVQACKDFVKVYKKRKLEMEYLPFLYEAAKENILLIYPDRDFSEFDKIFL